MCGLVSLKQGNLGRKEMSHWRGHGGAHEEEGILPVTLSIPDIPRYGGEESMHSSMEAERAKVEWWEMNNMHGHQQEGWVSRAGEFAEGSHVSHGWTNL